ncbi:hypothetical protein WJX81_000218 [Elliptochloris bilobata]|uniref:Nucleolar complex protein 2 n=1 Tax=Elliptochloris bilobata TaxID=381761 RepID=A0AAW1RNL3_9CHLO
MKGAFQQSLTGRPAQSEAAQHKAQLAALQEQDPEFYAYLQQSDRELLHFGEGSEDGSGGESGGEAPAEASDGGEEEEGPALGLQKEAARPQEARKLGKGKGGLLVSSELIDRWCRDARATCSYRAMRSLLRAYRFACHYGEREEDLDSALRITSVATMDRLVTFMLDEADAIFRGMLSLSGEAQLRGSDVTSASRWRRVEPLARAYLGNSLHLLSQLTEGSTLAHTLRRLRASAALLACSERLQRKYLRRALSVFLSGSAAARVHAFLFVRQVALAVPKPGLAAALKGVTRVFMQGAKFVSASSAPHIAFMGACVVDLHGLDAGEAYQHMFGHIRQLAATLRGALSNKTKDAFREVYCWQTVCCLELWARLLSAHADKEELRPLAFPVAQLLAGAARLVPTARYLPLRLRLLRALGGAGSGAAPGGPLLLRASKALLASPAYQQDVLEQVLELLATHLAGWACSAGFPELAHVPLLRLRRFAASTPVERFRSAAHGLAAALEANADFVAAERSRAGFAPLHACALQAFLAAEDAAQATPLQRYAALLADKARQRRDLLAAEQGQSRGDSRDGDRDGQPFVLSDDETD